MLRVACTGLLHKDNRDLAVVQGSCWGAMSVLAHAQCLHEVCVGFVPLVVCAFFFFLFNY